MTCQVNDTDFPEGIPCLERIFIVLKDSGFCRQVQFLDDDDDGPINTSAKQFIMGKYDRFIEVEAFVKDPFNPLPKTVKQVKQYNGLFGYPRK